MLLDTFKAVAYHINKHKPTFRSTISRSPTLADVLFRSTSLGFDYHRMVLISYILALLFMNGKYKIELK